MIGRKDSINLTDAPVSKALALVQRDFPLEEKVLITRSYRFGYQVLRALARTGVRWTNFRVETLHSLAEKVIEEDIAKLGITLLSHAAVEILVEDIFMDMASSGDLAYFKKHAVNKGMINALTNAVKEIRLAGISSKTLPVDVFVSPEKGQDIKELLMRYEERLDTSSYMDDAAMFHRAKENLARGAYGHDAKYLVFSRDYRTGVEREFLGQLASGRIISLDEGEVRGFKPPAGFWPPERNFEKGEVFSDAERLAWLFKSAKAPAREGDGTVRLFHACGKRNEIREVFRRILNSGLKFDEVEIVCSREGEYVPLIFSLCEKLGVGVTFTGGIPAGFSSAGRAMIGFLLWLKHDMSDRYLMRLLTSRDIVTPPCAGHLSSARLARALREAGLGWGRERYAQVLPKQIERAEEYLKNDDGDNEDYLKERLKALEALALLCDSFLKAVPEPDKDGKVLLKDMSRACVWFLDNFTRTSSEADRSFSSALKQTFRSVIDIARSGMLFPECVDKLLEMASSVKISATNPEPGHLHVSDIKTAGKSARRHTFLVGLDERRFPSQRGQDPVLLDGERTKLSDQLVLSEEFIRRELYDLAGFLSGLKGTLTASYSAYDIKQERAVFPSSVMLQIFRVAEGRPASDYEDLFGHLGTPKSFVSDPEEALDLSEWWVGKVARDEPLKNASGIVKEIYKPLAKGLSARKMREGPALNAFCGKISSEDDLDPRRTGRVLSSTCIETAARCPFKYFVQYVLGVRKPEGVEKDLNAWLDPLSRGELLHRVYQKYRQRVQEEKLADQAEKSAALYEELEKAIDLYKELIPSPGLAVCEIECERLRNGLRFFLQIDDMLGTRTVMTERSFGLEGEKPVALVFKDGGKILVKGRIDRIDKAGEHEYHVWDYKTGSVYAYSHRGYIKGGEQMQHVIYSEAAARIIKEILDEKAVVTRSGYLFPSEKGARGGKDLIFARDAREKHRWIGALTLILDIISEGSFFMAKNDYCRFCDLIEICGNENEFFGEKLTSENRGITLWKELKEYE